MQKSKIKSILFNLTQNTFTIRLLLFIVLVLIIQIMSMYFLSIKTPTITSKAATDTCSDPTGTEQYTSTISSIGSHLAANNNPENYKQIRKLYNCQNPPPAGGSSNIKTSYIPVVVIYDLFFLKGNVSGIKQNLEDMKKYGLYPVIRIGSYTKDNGDWIKLYPPTDAVIMAQNLSSALNQITGFPEKPIVSYFAEVNINLEWEGQTNPSEFAESFAAFYDAIGIGNFQLYFPSLSYGANISNGITPADFLQQFFASNKFGNRKLDGVDLNIYGTNYDDVKSQYTTQKSAFDNYLTN
ncbi:MAG: hypothetical protein Q7R95_06555, partial [bacterium]|nr:hypothetical protein [bacterium]